MVDALYVKIEKVFVLGTLALSLTISASTIIAGMLDGPVRISIALALYAVEKEAKINSRNYAKESEASICSCLDLFIMHFKRMKVVIP